MATSNNLFFDRAPVNRHLVPCQLGCSTGRRVVSSNSATWWKAFGLSAPSAGLHSIESNPPEGLSEGDNSTYVGLLKSVDITWASLASSLESDISFLTNAYCARNA